MQLYKQVVTSVLVLALYCFRVLYKLYCQCFVIIFNLCGIMTKLLLSWANECAHSLNAAKKYFLPGQWWSRGLFRLEAIIFVNLVV